MRIEYSYFDSPAQRAEAERALLPILPILPYWAETIRVERYGHGEDQSAAASVTCMPEYRWIRIELYHRLFDNPAEKIHEMIAHEVCHALVAPLANWMRDRVIKPLFDGQLKSVLERECEDRVEAVVQDLALSLGRHPYGIDYPADSDEAKLAKAEAYSAALRRDYEASRAEECRAREILSRILRGRDPEVELHGSLSDICAQVENVFGEGLRAAEAEHPLEPQSPARPNLWPDIRIEYQVVDGQPSYAVTQRDGTRISFKDGLAAAGVAWFCWSGATCDQPIPDGVCVRAHEGEFEFKRFVSVGGSMHEALPAPDNTLTRLRAAQEEIPRLRERADKAETELSLWRTNGEHDAKARGWLVPKDAEALRSHAASMEAERDEALQQLADSRAERDRLYNQLAETRYAPVREVPAL